MPHRNANAHRNALTAMRQMTLDLKADSKTIELANFQLIIKS